ncbi:MAG: GTP-binding protein EngA, partial [uncultured Nocardioides sp.]
DRRHARDHRRRGVRVRSGARAGHRGPPQRREVDAGQPHHRPPGGRGGGPPRRDPGPCLLRCDLERPVLHRRRHRWLGPRCARARQEHRRPGRGRGLPGRRGPLRRGRRRRDHRLRRGGRAHPAQVRQAGRAGRQQGRRPARRGGGLRPVEPRPGRADARLRPARPGHGRPARRRARGPAGDPARDVRRGGRSAPHRHRGQAQRRQVLAAQQARRRRAGRGRQRRRHHRRPGRRAHRARWRDLALHRHRRHPQAGQGGLRPGVLRLPAHHDRDRPCRGRRARARRQPDGLRAGHADHPDHPRLRPGHGHRLQQVGPGRRGAPLLPRARDRARPRPGAVGPPHQRHRPHRLARRPAGAGAGEGAGGLGDPHLDRCAEHLPGSPGLRAPAPGARGQAAPDHVRDAALHGSTDVRAVHQRQARRVVREVHRAAPAGAVRLRRHPDRAAAAPAREAQAL